MGSHASPEIECAANNLRSGWPLVRAFDNAPHNKVSILRKLRAAVSLDARTRWLMLVSAILRVAISTGFRLVGVSETQRYVRTWASRAQNRQWFADPRELIRNAQRAQGVVRRNTGIGGRCLARSLTLWGILLRFGVATDLRVGMRKRNGLVEGHAWLEYQGVPINESGELIETYDVYPDPVSFYAWVVKAK